MSKAIGNMHNNLCRLFSMYSARIGLQMHDNVGVVDQKRSAVNAAFHSSYGSHLSGTAALQMTRGGWSRCTMNLAISVEY